MSSPVKGPVPAPVAAGPMMRMSGYKMLTDSLVQNIIGVIRACAPTSKSGLSNGELMDVMEDLSRQIMSQQTPDKQPKE